jgi:hypothetical protein
MKTQNLFVASIVAVAGLAVGSASASNLIINGDFQAGNITPSTSSFSFQTTAGPADLPIDSINDEGTY